MVAAAAATLSACQYPGGTIFNSSTQGNAVITTTDARQRVITNHNPNEFSRPGLITPIQVICTEPSPDVALAVANSFAAGVSILQRGGGSVGSQQSQALVQLAERTATLQILREQLFRACEAYSNGAITGTTYSLMLSKLYQAVATLALADTAGGNFGRSLAAAGVQANADASASMSGFASAINDVKEAAQKLAGAEEKVVAAQKDVTQQEKIANAATEEPAKANEAKKLDDLKAALARATGERDATRELLKGKLETTGKAGGQVSNVIAGGGIARAPSEAVAGVIGRMLETFLASDNSQSVIAACLVELGMRHDNSDADVKLYEQTIAEFFARPGKDAAQSLAQDKDMLARAASLVRRTALYRHCDTYLAEYVRTASASESKQRMAGIELDRRKLEVRELELKVSGARRIAEAYAACGKIESRPSQDQCIALVTGYGAGTRGAGQEKPGAEHTGQAEPEVRPMDAWLELDKAVKKLSALRADLDGLELAAPRSDQDKARNKDLEDRRKEAKGHADKSLAGGKSVTDTWTQHKVVEVQNERYTALALLNGARTPVAATEARAGIGAQSAKAKALKDLFDATRQDVGAATGSVETVILQLKAYQKKP